MLPKSYVLAHHAPLLPLTGLIHHPPHLLLYENKPVDSHASKTAHSAHSWNKKNIIFKDIK